MFALDSAHGPGTPPFVHLSTSSPHDLSSVRESLILTIKYRMLREGETKYSSPLSPFISDAFFKRWNL